MVNMTTSNEEPKECHAARASMAAFFASGFKVGDDAARQERMRQHMAGCPACAEAYAEMGRTTAAFRGIADRRALSDAARRGSWRESRPKARGLGAMSVFFAWNREPPSSAVVRLIWRLRPLLVVAFFIFLITELTQPREPGPRFEVRWTAGKVVVDGKELLDNLPNFGLDRGGEVRTSASGGALVSRAETELVLGANSHLLVERISPPRLRLVLGELTAQGPFDLGVGSVMLASQAKEPANVRILLSTSQSNQVLLELLAGELDVVTPRLEEHLVAPARLRLDAFGERVPGTSPQPVLEQ